VRVPSEVESKGRAIKAQEKCGYDLVDVGEGAWGVEIEGAVAADQEVISQG